MPRLHLLIHGRVQGVYFRSDARDRARALGLTGWVRNRLDGDTVEIVAEGPAEKLEIFRDWCRQGPPGAYVRRVEELTESETGEFTDFQARYSA